MKETIEEIKKILYPILKDISDCNDWDERTPLEKERKAQPIIDLIQNAKEEERENRDEAWRAYLQKLAQ